MATGIFLDKEDTENIRDATIVNAEVDEDGHLILTRYDGSTVDAGYVMGSSTPEDVNPEPNTLMKRSALGRSQVETPVSDKDVVNKLYLDTNIAAAIAAAAASGTAEATPDTIMRRDASARSKVANPSAATDIANKQYVDGKTFPASAITSGIFDVARIPNLDAGKITSGAFADARIPNLNASKITAGALSVDCRWTNSVRAMANGNESISISAANTPSSKTITFPAGRFSATPVVMVSANTSTPGTLVTGVGYNAATSTGVTLWVSRTNTTSTNVAWLALQI